MSNAFDPSAYFQQQFDLLGKQATSSNPALRAQVKPKLLTLLQQYKLKLPLATHQERTVEAGQLLASLGEHETALRQCFSPILMTANTEGLAAKGLSALRLRVQADFGSVACSFEILMWRDPRIEHDASTKTVRDLLRRVREGLGACVKHEDLYWQVLNGTRLAYRLCTTLMRPERAADAIETLAWCALCMEGMLPLIAPRFCEWRIQLYTALCHCYEAAGVWHPSALALPWTLEDHHCHARSHASCLTGPCTLVCGAGMLDGAAKAVAHALDRHEWLKKLDRHDPVPQTAETDALYTSVERKLGALQFKYTTCRAPAEAEAEPAKGKAPPPKKGEPEPDGDGSPVGAVFRGVALETVFGPSAEAQLTCLLEAMSDYSTDPRPLAHEPPSEERLGLVKELFAQARHSPRKRIPRMPLSRATLSCHSLMPLSHGPLSCRSHGLWFSRIAAQAMALASPHLAALTTHEETKATLAAATADLEAASKAAREAAKDSDATAAVKAKADADKAAAGGEEVAEGEDDPLATAAAAALAASEEANAATEAATAALGEATAAEAAAGEAVGGAEGSLPLPLHVGLLKVACMAEMWDEVDMIAPAAKVRVDKALNALIAATPVDVADASARAGLPEVASGTNTVAFAGANSSLAFTGTNATLSPAEGDAPVSSAPNSAPSEAGTMWIDVSILSACRAMDVAAEEHKLGSMHQLANVLQQCGGPDLSESAAARKDILADAAVRLWEACVPAIALADEEASSQQPTHGASLPGLPALRRVGGGQKDTGSQLSISLKPKSKADGAKLVGAIEKIGKTDAHFSHVVDPRSGVITVTGSGEMHLQTICDKAKLASGAECAVGPVLSPSTTHGGAKPSDNTHPSAGFKSASGNVGEADGPAKKIEPAQLAKLLVPVHWTLRAVGLCDDLLRASIAVRLVDLLTQEGSPGTAVDVARSSVADLEAARSKMIVDLAERGLQGAPSASVSSVLASHLAPYTTPFDATHQALACVHTDTLLLLFRGELALGLRKETKKKRDEHAALRKAQLKRREQQHIYGVRSRADAQREELEDESGPEVPQTAPACEQRLLGEFSHDVYAKALLLLEMAPYAQPPTHTPWRSRTHWPLALPYPHALALPYPLALLTPPPSSSHLPW